MPLSWVVLINCMINMGMWRASSPCPIPGYSEGSSSFRNPLCPHHMAAYLLPLLSTPFHRKKALLVNPGYFLGNPACDQKPKTVISSGWVRVGNVVSEDRIAFLKSEVFFFWAMWLSYLFESYIKKSKVNWICQRYFMLFHMYFSRTTFLF